MSDTPSGGLLKGTHKNGISIEPLNLSMEWMAHSLRMKVASGMGWTGNNIFTRDFFARRKDRRDRQGGSEPSGAAVATIPTQLGERYFCCPKEKMSDLSGTAP